MGDFSDFAKICNQIAKHPTQGEQQKAREEGLKPFVAAAQANLAANGSDKTGALSASLGVAPVDASTSAAGPLKGKRHSTVGHLVEFGTAPHFQPNRGTMHPGAAPKPFMRPAFEETKVTIVQQAAASLAKSIFGQR